MEKPFLQYLYDMTCGDRLCTEEVNTWKKDVDWQYIYTKFIPISEALSFRGIPYARRYLKAEGSFLYSGVYTFLVATEFTIENGFSFNNAKAGSPSNTGLIPGGATEGGVCITYTKDIKNENPMDKYIAPMALFSTALLGLFFISSKVGNVLAFFQ